MTFQGSYLMSPYGGNYGEGVKGTTPLIFCRKKAEKKAEEKRQSDNILNKYAYSNVRYSVCGGTAATEDTEGRRSSGLRPPS